MSTTKGSTRMILIHVQKMLDPNLGRTCRIEALGNMRRWGILEFAHSRAIVA